MRKILSSLNSHRDGVPEIYSMKMMIIMIMITMIIKTSSPRKRERVRSSVDNALVSVFKNIFYSRSTRLYNGQSSSWLLSSSSFPSYLFFTSDIDKVGYPYPPNKTCI